MKWKRKTKTDVEIETSAGIITFPPSLNLTEEQVAAFRDVFNGVTHATCDATDVVQGFFGSPVTLGPCVLRRGHEGAAHKGASGAQWWPTGHTHAGTANAAEAEAARRVIATVTESELHDAIRKLAQRDPAWWRNELARMAHIEGRADILGGHK